MPDCAWEAPPAIRNDDFCPRSHGYWKKDTERWPTDWLELGGVEYELEELMAFLRYKGPDASNHLALQLVATKLNLERGGYPFILPVVDEADVFLELYPPGTNPRGAARDAAHAIKDELDAYNTTECPATAAATAALSPGMLGAQASGLRSQQGGAGETPALPAVPPPPPAHRTQGPVRERSELSPPIWVWLFGTAAAGAEGMADWAPTAEPLAHRRAPSQPSGAT